MVDQLFSGPCVAIEVRAEKAVSAFRELCGPSDPAVAKHIRPDTLRAKFGTDRLKNAVHCTDLAEDGTLEVRGGRRAVVIILIILIEIDTNNTLV